jgi:hypothetical protein
MESSQLIFVPREPFLSCPSAHTGCSAGFKVLASVLEGRVQLADGVVDMDAVGSLTHSAPRLGTADCSALSRCLYDTVFFVD